MASANILLDKRVPDKTGFYRVKLRITNNNTQAYISLPYKLKLQDWDDRNNKIRKSCTYYNYLKENIYFQDYKNSFDDFLLDISKSNNIRIYTASDLKAKFLNINNSVNIGDLFNEFIKIKLKDNPGSSTAGLYQLTLSHIEKFKGKTDFSIELVTPDFLNDFDIFLKKTNKTNSRGIHMRNLRAIYNHAIQNNILSYANYPFRNFKIKTEKTLHRVIDIDLLRKLFNHVSHVKQRNTALDIFKLCFYLVGINIKDLLYLKHDCIDNGRVYYSRFKTGANYNIKIIPEAQELIDKHKGKEYLLNFLENKLTKSPENRLKFMHNDITNTTNKRLKLILEKELNIPIKISTYFARHSWATIAMQSGISKDIIKISLGHKSNDVTGIYIEYPYDVVDKANDAVMQNFRSDK